MSAFIHKELLEQELEDAIERCNQANVPTPNLDLIMRKLKEGRFDWQPND